MSAQSVPLDQYLDGLDRLAREAKGRYLEDPKDQPGCGIYRPVDEILWLTKMIRKLKKKKRRRKR